MGHKRRVWYPEAKYHIICRGNKKQNIFLDTVDHLIYLDIVREVKARYDFLILTYCLMPNHIHLQIRTKNIEIWRIMRGSTGVTQDILMRDIRLLAMFFRVVMFPKL
jgi:REP element-mobilizing transposase RayT